MTIYQVIINQGLGFTEQAKEFSNIKDACNHAKQYDNAKIYKKNKRVL